jgi:hypothetical protein
MSLRGLRILQCDSRRTLRPAPAKEEMREAAEPAALSTIDELGSNHRQLPRERLPHVISHRPDALNGLLQLVCGNAELLGPVAELVILFWVNALAICVARFRAIACPSRASS